MNYGNDFWALHEDVVFCRSGGQIIWQPRVECWISDRMYSNGKLPGEYEGLSKVDIYKKLGCSNRIYDYNSSYYKKLPDDIKWSSKQLNNETVENRIDTPVGYVTQVIKSSKNSWAWLVCKQWASTEDDIKVWTYIEENSEWGFSIDNYNATKDVWNRLGAPCIFLPRTSLQSLYIDIMGVENTIYALEDYPDTIDCYLKALSDSHMRLIDAINKSPINIVNFGDNLHSGTLSPELFKKYVLPEYQKRTDSLHKHGKFVYSHYDGNNKGLMEYYHETGLDGIEAITPLPQGDVTLEEVKKHLGNMFMVDGIPAVYFDELYPIEILKKEVEKIIELFAPNLVLGISDEISSTGNIDRIKIVGEIVDNYNSKFI